MARKRPTRWTHKRVARFLELLCLGNTVSHAAEIAGFARQTLYERKALDADFSAAWDEAHEAGTEAMEQEAKRRAIEGTIKPLTSRGEVVWASQKDGQIVTADTEGARLLPVMLHEYSDTLLIFLLKGRKPEVYRENVNISGRIQSDLSGLLTLARQSADYDMAPEPNRVLPGRAGEDALDETSGDRH